MLGEFGRGEAKRGTATSRTSAFLKKQTKDVFAVLPTDFGKSLIHQSYSEAKTVRDAVASIVIVVKLY